MEQYLSYTLSVVALLVACGTLVAAWMKQSNMVAVMKTENKNLCDRVDKIEKKNEILHDMFHKTEETLVGIENKLENVLEFVKDIKSQNERLIRLEARFDNK